MRDRSADTPNQQADFEKQVAKFGLIVGAARFVRKSCADAESFFSFYLVPLRQGRDLAVGKVAARVVGDCQQVCLL
jgi:hypothetical protein